MSIEIQLKRCLCIHSISQVVEIILQNLLYQRGTIPQPVANLLKDDAKNGSFCDRYKEIQSLMRSVFRSRNSNRVLEFVILFGPSPSSAKEIYRVPLNFCDVHKPDENGCSENCGELTPREKRDVFMTMLQSSSSNSPPQLSNTAKVFFFIRTTEKLPDFVENLEHDETFELPDDNISSKKKIHQETLWVKHDCADRKEIHLNSYCNDGIWLRVMFFLNKVAS